ncbi:DUF1254 domain-containing protein [Flavobacterium sp.]|jgi:hypothetical protein|uniref:DUF1254 domain-containing protein n=1 Tax=Flavobacterium sp. TaxID=239 RepID=UPI0037C11782
MKHKTKITGLLSLLLATITISCNQKDKVATSKTDNTEQTQTGDNIVTRFGDLKLESGYPSEDAITKLYDERDFQRACQIHTWALPMVGFHGLHLAQRDQLGVKDGEISMFFDLKDKSGMLTPNITTLYAFSFWNFDKQGALVIDAPAGLIAGGLLDLWQQPITDIGQTGPDKGAGGKYLFLPPGSKMIAAPGYRVYISPTVQVWFGTRALDPDPKIAEETIRKFKIYSWNDRSKATVTNFVTVNGKVWTSAQPTDANYFKMVAEALEPEPIQTRDRVIYGMMASLGMEKGKPFQPDERLTKILNEAAMVGELTARVNAYEKRFDGSVVWKDKHWEYANMVELNQEDSNYTQLDQRASWFYEAIGNSTGMQGRILGFGQAYLETSKDKAGKWLVGSKSYHFHVPANAPVKQFWSITLYDNVTRGPLVTDQGSADMSSRKDIEKNADGSVDIYFGPTKPKGANKNYIKTLPGKGWFPYFRFYGPTETYFDKTWQLEDIEEIK